MAKETFEQKRNNYKNKENTINKRKYLKNLNIKQIKFKNNCNIITTIRIQLKQNKKIIYQYIIKEIKTNLKREIIIIITKY